MEFTSDFCELIGSIIGDGNLYNKGPYYVEITGDPKSDVSYFKNFLLITIRNELNYIAKMRTMSRGLRVRINNKAFVNFLAELGIPVGEGKCKTVIIPEGVTIFKKYVKSCIRGIFDTDGGVHFDKRKIYKRPYIRIELHMSSKQLLYQISSILKELDVKSTVPKNKNTMFINGKISVRKYLKIIGFRNIRHIRKIEKFYPELPKFNCAPIA